MEKEKILSTLTEKLGKTSLSGRSIETYVNNNLPADGTEPDDAYFAKHVNVLKSFSGQYDHDFAAAVEDYKKQNPKPAVDGGDGGAGGNGAGGGDDKLAAMQKQIDELINANKEKEARLGVEKLRSGVMGKAGELKISTYKNVWEDVVNSTDLSDCKTEDEALTKCKGAFERLVKRYYTDKAKPYGSAETTPKHTDSELKKRREAYLAQLKAEGKIPEAE